jgi:hypothetical protein
MTKKLLQLRRRLAEKVIGLLRRTGKRWYWLLHLNEKI